ncbi:MAG: hypothetical protein ACXAB7_24910 [Candidatus Kariarchaeaceae archaeon]|jgi:hypothetical protein
MRSDIFLFLLIIVLVSNPVYSTSRQWDWSEDIEPGDVLIWNVEKFWINGQTVNRADGFSAWLREGSLISIEILEDPIEFDWIYADPEDYLHYFKILIDGVERETIDLIQFVFPVSYQYSDGTTVNVFEEAAREKGFFYYYLGGMRTSVNQNIVTQTVQDDFQNLEIITDLNSGIMQRLHQTLSNGDELIIENEDYEHPKNNENNGLYVIMILAGLLLLILSVVILWRRKKAF